MTALANGRNTPYREGNRYSLPVAAAKVLYPGALCALDASGNATPGATATGLKGIGRVEALADNGSGSAGDIRADIRPGIYRWANSTSTKLPWLKNIPGLRQWIGDRQFHSLEASAYEFPKVEHEDSVSVPLRDIEADQYGIYGPYMRMMGEAYAAFPDEKIWGAVAAGFTTNGYDGVPLFSANHPVIDADGATQSVSNLQDGSGSAWYLMVSNRGVKPLIWSPRKEEGFKPLLPPELVDREKRMDYGCYVDAGVGYGFWQLIFASKATLDATNYGGARAAIMDFYGDHGRKLGLVPDLLICAASNEGAARKVVKNSLATGGETNEWAGTADVLVSPWLT